jgi:putative endonuclease
MDCVTLPPFRHPREGGDPAALRGGWVYILASRYRGTLYIGVTANLAACVLQHREGKEPTSPAATTSPFWSTSNSSPNIRDAIARETAPKKWRREWKLNLIERDNPEWDDLFERING